MNFKIGDKVKNQINFIYKFELKSENLECIEINYNDINRSQFNLCFPYFIKNSMYKNMKLGKKYTLAELNLD